MALTLGTSIRQAVITNALAKFELEVTITDRGDMPDTQLFLMEIREVDDPKTDVLARIITIADLKTYGTDRPTALLVGDPFYRAPTITKQYDALDDAIAAKDFIEEELNNLVTQYVQYITEFEALTSPDIDIFFPVTDAGILQPLIDDYNDVKTQREAQEQAVTDKTAECAELDQEYTDAVARQAELEAELAALTDAQNSLSFASSSMTAFRDAGAALGVEVNNILVLYPMWNDPVNMSAPAKDAFDDLLADNNPGPPGDLWNEYELNYKQAQTQFDQDIITVQTSASNLQARIDQLTGTLVPDATTDRDNALTAKETCTGELGDANAALRALEREEQDLLNQILALCPTFTP